MPICDNLLTVRDFKSEVMNKQCVISVRCTKLSQMTIFGHVFIMKLIMIKYILILIFILFLLVIE